MTTVLIVDDDGAILEYLFEIITDLGLKAIPKRSAEDALDLKEHLDEISLLITDIKMPGLNGFELIEKLRSMGYSYPMLAVSGLADLDRSMYADKISSEADFKPTKFIRKPFNDIDIITELKLLNFV